MRPYLTFTLDLEDHRLDTSLPARFPDITEKILDFLDQKQIKATIFTVGKLAKDNPNLIKKIYKRGHEIAHHSYDHTVLTQQTPDKFHQDTKRAKDILEDITGNAVTGYRAPVFSLTQDTLWAVDILKELGFAYSSSTLPATNPLHGFKGLPNHIFKWSNGLIEIPAPIANSGGLQYPYLGGFYLRYLPVWLIKRHLNTAQEQGNADHLWTYCHPYDFDPDEKNWRIKGASPMTSLLLWCNRKNTFNKIEELVTLCEINPPFTHQALEESALQVIDPATL